MVLRDGGYKKILLGGIWRGTEGLEMFQKMVVRRRGE